MRNEGWMRNDGRMEKKEMWKESYETVILVGWWLKVD